VPLVTVVIPCRNAGNRLADCLASALAQTHADLEVIVVDDASTDGSADRAREILARAGRPFHVVAGEGRGPGAARNLGLSKARGDYVQWLDADDELAASKIARQLEIASGDFVVPVTDYAWCITDAAATAIEAMPVAVASDPLLDFLLGGAPQIATFLFSRPLADRLRELGVFDESTPIGEDREYATVAAMLGARFVHVPLVGVMYFQWSASLQASRAADDRTRWDAMQAIQRRLRQTAARCGAAPSDEARWALGLDFAPFRWQVARVENERPWWRTEIQLEDGRTLAISPLEASIVEARKSAPAIATLELFARAACERTPELRYRVLDVRRALEALAARGALVAT
jgi:glycosyltransferase involved in cell wall biosynthesis